MCTLSEILTGQIKYKWKWVKKKWNRGFLSADSITSTHTTEDHHGEHCCDSGDGHAASGWRKWEKKNTFVIFCNAVVSVICVRTGFYFSVSVRRLVVRTLTWCYWWVGSSPEGRSCLRSWSGTETSCWPRCPAETSSPGPGSHFPSAPPLQQSCAHVWSCRLDWKNKNQWKKLGLITGPGQSLEGHPFSLQYFWGRTVQTVHLPIEKDLQIKHAWLNEWTILNAFAKSIKRISLDAKVRS